MKFRLLMSAVITACSTVAFAATATVNGITWTYTVSNGKATLGGGSSSSPAIPKTTMGAITIPYTLGGCPVTSIGDYAFSYCSGLTNVSIPSSVTSIGDSAFSDCSGLTSVTIPDSVTYIGDYAFSGCSGLLEVSIPQYVCSSQMSSVFPEAYSQITNVVISSTVTTIGANAFSNCSGLTSVTIPYGVTSIGANAFSNCNGLTSITIPNSVAGFSGYGVTYFDGCYGLKNVKIPQCLCSGGGSSFSGLGPVASIFNDARNCITNIIVADGVRFIGAGSFMGCSNVERVAIPDSVTRIDANVFEGCDSKLYDTLTISGVRMVDGWVVATTPSLTDSIDLTGVRGIAAGAFSGCSGLTNVTLPQCVTSLEETLPFSYQSLTNVVLAEGISQIPGKMFSGCSNLRTITIPDSVTCVGDEAFAYCNSLVGVLFKGDAPDMGTDVFLGTPKRVVISVPDNSIGWNGGLSSTLPETFGGRAIVHSGETYDWSSGAVVPGGGGEGARNVNLTITNVVVHYVLNSIQPEIALPASSDVGLVAVMTEIKGGAVAIPSEWATNYPSFSSLYGSDFATALTKPNGKSDGAGGSMCVWTDYVAGTDPTNPADVFKASITFVDGEPLISWTPELPEEQAALRKYTVYGKTKLNDENWAIVNGNASDYNFFKVTVEMR